MAPHSQAALKYLLQDYLHCVPFTALSSCHFLLGSWVLSGVLKWDSPNPCHCHTPQLPRAGSVGQLSTNPQQQSPVEKKVQAPHKGLIPALRNEKEEAPPPQLLRVGDRLTQGIME